MSGAQALTDMDQTPAQLSPSDVIGQSFDLALKAHNQGDPEGAEQLYRAILACQPTHADALHGMGVLAEQAARPDLAEVFIAEAISQRDDPTFRNNLGLVLLALGRPREALASVQRALELRADYPAAYNALGNVQMALGRRDDATQSYQTAMELRPAYVDAQVNLAKAQLEQLKFEAARDSCLEALRLRPDCPEAHNTLGNALRLMGQQDEALSSFNRALEIRPSYAEAHNNRAVILMVKEKLDEAEASARSALACKPDFPAALTTLGSVHILRGKYDDGASCFERAVRMDPECVEAQNNLGSTYLQMDRLPEAIEAFERAIALTKGELKAELNYNLGTTLVKGDRIEEAIHAFDNALGVDPHHAAAANNRGVALLNKGMVVEAVAAYGQSIASDPQYAGAYSNRLMTMHYIEAYNNDDILEVARDFGRVFGRPDPRGFPDRDLSPDRRLRVGYVSGDFNMHPVALFLIRTLIAHDHKNFEIFCYSNWPHDDIMTTELRGLADHWRQVVDVSDDDVASTIRADEIDILVDLSGHTNKTRVSLFGLKAAPVQVSWIGYFGTTGLDSMDYIILDPVSAPKDTDRWYVEKIIRMPHGRFCYQPPPVDMPMAEPPCLANGHVTFGSFNNVAKIGPAVLDLWARILLAVPDARLIMKWRTLSADSVKERFTQSFVQRGIAPERIEFRSAVSHALLFAEYNEIDIALDPFPFGGATTSCEALWMGVPVVTWPGERLASRQTYAFLHVMGFDELAAASREDYIDLAVALARDPERLRRLRRELRPALVNAPFSDGPKFTATLEAAYRQIWRRYVSGESPEAFEIKG